MKKLIIHENASIRSQIVDYYRDLIRQKELLPGDVLPPARKLAGEIGTAEGNVHYALATLVKEGLIARRPRAGSVVLEQQKISRVAFFMNYYFFRLGERFSQPLVDHVEEELAKHGIECLIIYDTNSGFGIKHLVKLAKTRQVQGIIARHFFPEDWGGISKSNIPIASVIGRRMANGIGFYTEDLLRSMIAGLKANGCKSFGVIAPGICCDPRNASGGTFYADFPALGKEFGLDCRPDWLFGNLNVDGINIGDFAYHAMNKIWQLPQRPDGILVCSEDIIGGLTMALYQNKINVPQDIQFAIHSTSQYNDTIPFPCTLFEHSSAELAQKLVTLILDQAEGKKITRQTLTIPTPRRVQ